MVLLLPRRMIPALTVELVLPQRRELPLVLEGLHGR